MGLIRSGIAFNGDYTQSHSCKSLVRSEAVHRDAMKIEQFKWTEGEGWNPALTGKLGDAAQLILLFGGTALLKQERHLATLKSAYPKAHLLGCSTSGEICATEVLDDSLVVTAISFEYTRLQRAHVMIGDVVNSFAAGEHLAKSLDKNELKHVFVLSDGLSVNGSDLVAGLTNLLPADVSVTGGLSGDGARFQETLVFSDDEPKRNVIVVLGLYGSRLKVGYGSSGGWDPFGPERLITRAEGNVLYELDGKSALALYKTYLGEHAEGLPATGLLFPLSIRTNHSGTAVVRTILSVSEKDQSMTFAGDVSAGAYARLMKANSDRLIDGAAEAAKTSYEAAGAVSPELAVLVSCVGRKLVLKQRTEEEVESVRDIVGQETVLTGFYSYGEIAPFAPGARCDLHNQTMTITTFSER